MLGREGTSRAGVSPAASAGEEASGSAARPGILALAGTSCVTLSSRHPSAHTPRTSPQNSQRPPPSQPLQPLRPQPSSRLPPHRLPAFRKAPHRRLPPACAPAARVAGARLPRAPFPGTNPALSGRLATRPATPSASPTSLSPGPSAPPDQPDAHSCLLSRSVSPSREDVRAARARGGLSGPRHSPGAGRSSRALASEPFRASVPFARKRVGDVRSHIVEPALRTVPGPGRGPAKG